MWDGKSYLAVGDQHISDKEDCLLVESFISQRLEGRRDIRYIGEIRDKIPGKGCEKNGVKPSTNTEVSPRGEGTCAVRGGTKDSQSRSLRGVRQLTGCLKEAKEEFGEKKPKETIGGQLRGRDSGGDARIHWEVFDYSLPGRSTEFLGGIKL